VQRRKLNLKPKTRTASSYFSFKRLVPGAFNTRFNLSTCTASPWPKEGMTGCAASPMRVMGPLQLSAVSAGRSITREVYSLSVGVASRQRLTLFHF